MPISGRTVLQSTIGLLAVGFLALLAIVGMTIWLGERAQRSFGEVIEARDIRTLAVDLRAAVQTAESSQRGYIATSNEIYLAPFDRATTQAARLLERLRATRVQQESPELLSRLSATVTDKIAEMDQTITLMTEGRDAEAMEIVRTNRGKALMDEADVFISGIVRAADERLTASVEEQRRNAGLLRLLSIAGGVVIVVVAAIAVVTVQRYTREITVARDEVRVVNTTLERRVEDRTADLARARDRAQLLLAEVNHRVANSLALVAALVRLQSRALDNPAAKDALVEIQGRIDAVSLVHKRLYASGEVGLVALDEYLAGLLDQLQASLRGEGHGAMLRYELEPLKARTDASVNMGVVVAEWVTNAFKYAYPNHTGEIRVFLKSLPDGRGELVVEDDGVGRAAGAPAQGTGIGSRIVTAMAASMDAQADYIPRNPGTAARLVFPAAAG